MESDIIVRVARESDEKYAECITTEMEDSAIKRGTGISKRSPEYIRDKMRQGKAVIALTTGGTWIGFSYIEEWSNGEFVSNSGLIVDPAWRGKGIATRIKETVFQLARKTYPHAKIFSITTSMAIMKLNTSLGFVPVVFDAITHDARFWQGCKSCANFGILESKGYKNCLCTAMLFNYEQR
jgi:GNAT superfamily N-acetyltransferase